MEPRTIRQPGPPAAERIAAVPCAAIRIDEALPPGQPLLAALHALLARHGADSACLHLAGGGLHPFAFVIPALSPDGSQAAFYSATFRPGPVRLHAAAVTVGFREGEPFFHCHALWTAPDGTPGCGHVLPAEATVAAPIRATGALLFGANFATAPDPETGFSLLAPAATTTPAPDGALPAIALRLAPNQDLMAALESAAPWPGGATVAGGVASIIGARFTEGPDLEGFATEMLVRRGTVSPGATALDVAIIDLHGTIREGALAPYANPVLMTFEGALIPA